MEKPKLKWSSLLATIAWASWFAEAWLILAGVLKWAPQVIVVFAMFFVVALLASATSNTPRK